MLDMIGDCVRAFLLNQSDLIRVRDSVCCNERDFFSLFSDAFFLLNRFMFQIGWQTIVLFVFVALAAAILY